jgi:RNA polymerase sigma-70 factor (ECF subfamily)
MEARPRLPTPDSRLPTPDTPARHPVLPARRMPHAMGARAIGARVYCPEREQGRSRARTVHRARSREAALGNRVDYASQTDEALVDLLHRGDVQALETLYARHARAVYSLSLKMLGEQAGAEEVVQEAFLKLWRQPELYRSDRGRLSSWLLGVTHHRAVDQLRRRRLEARHSANGEVQPSAGPQTDPEQQLWDSVQAEAVWQALADLPPSQRLTLELAYLRGMTQAEIAAYLGEPLGTIKTRMRLAMQKLRSRPELAALIGDGA